MSASLADIVRAHAVERPDAGAIIYRDRTVTFRQLDERSSRFASALVAAGVSPQERVAFFDKNGPEYFDAVFGAAKLNAVLCPVNWRLAPREAAFVINDTDAKVLIVGEEVLPVLAEMEPELTTVKTVVVIGDRGDRQTAEQYEPWLARHPASDPGVEPSADDVALQMYSSGTTGRPKGVMLTNGNFFSGVEANGEVLEMSASSVNLVAMPLFHVAGGAWGITGLSFGCPNVLLRDVDPFEILRLIQEYRITHTVLVPAVIQVLISLPGVEDADFSSMEVLVYGASPISEAVLTGAIERIGCKFVQAYGLTETTGGVVILPPADHDPAGPNRHRLRAAGRAGPNTQLRVTDPDAGEDAPPGVVGEVLIRSPQNMKGYWNLPEETAETILDDGWLRSGDAGYLDEDGYLYIHDRVKDMIISGGENIYPAEVENVLMSHPAIADAAVIGVPDERWGETPKAIVVARPDQNVDAVNVIAFARERLAHYKCPTSVDVVDELPRNPSGKVLKRELRAPYWEGHQRSVN
jgi:long-chain acyl-CoA synthetase